VTEAAAAALALVGDTVGMAVFAAKAMAALVAARRRVAAAAVAPILLRNQGDVFRTCDRRRQQ